MPRLVVALSAVSSGRSSWLVLGVSGIAYAQGASAVWAVVGDTTAELLQCLYLGPRLRTETERLGSITLLDYLESRFGDTSHRLRILGSLIIGVFITAYVAAQLHAGAKTLTSALGMNLGLGLLLSALLILVYMVLGGYVAVAWNDVVRAVLMLLALVALPAYGSSSAASGRCAGSSSASTPRSWTRWLSGSAPSSASWASGWGRPDSPTSWCATCPSTTLAT